MSRFGARPTVELGPLIDQIDWRIPAEDQLPKPRQYRPRRVSASGVGDCSREWYYKLARTTAGRGREVRKREWDLAAAYGDVIHDQIQAALVEQGLVEAVERYLPGPEVTGNFLSGRVDGVLTGRPALLEIKTVAQKYWSLFPEHDKFAKYQAQIQVYLETLGLPEALLVCVRRDPIVEGKTDRLRKSLVKEFIIPRERAAGARLIAKANRIREAVQTDTVPPAEPSDSCFFCAYAHICKVQDIRDSLLDAEAGQTSPAA